MDHDRPAQSPSTPLKVLNRVVLTGGPGAGKTAISAEMARRHPALFARVPEAATQVYDALGTRWDRLDLAGRRGVQLRIYRLQLEQERAAGVEHAGRVLLLDRGTVDGAAYWPEGPDDYWRTLGTSGAAERGRYDAVLWLETAAAVATEDGGYDGPASNACRHEGADDAVASGRRVRAVWAEHPRFYEVQAAPRFEEKVRAVERALLREVAGGGD